MSFIEKIFGNSFHATRRLFFPNLSDRLAKLNLREMNAPRYSTLLSLLVGKEFSVKFNPHPSILVIDQTLLLPQSVLLMESSERVIRYLVVQVATMLLEPNVKKRCELEHSSQLRYPFYLEMKNSLSTIESSFCEKLLEELKMESRRLETKNEAPLSFQANKPSAKNTAKVQSSPHVRTIDLSSTPDNPLIHMFEKVQTAEDYQGGSRSIEDADHLEEEESALKEVLFSTVIRTNQTSSGLLETEASWSGVGKEKEPEAVSKCRIVHRREWFHRQNKYADDWCQVYLADDHPVHLNSKEVAPDIKSLAKTLKDKLAFIANKNATLKRQRFGEDFDFDALIRSAVDFRATGSFDDRIYLHRKRIEKDLGVLFLVDTSMSTEAWVQGECGLELLKKFLCIVSRSFEGVIESVQIDRFFSYTRRQCHYRQIKKFDAPWQGVEQSVLNIAAEGYTRMGPAIRQAISEFSEKGFRKKHRKRFRKKILFILSDCKPTDYDAYEGKHGNDDVRKAVQEAAAEGIVTHAFVIAAGYNANAERMFDKKRVSFVATPKQFADEIFEVLRLIFRGV